MGSVNQASSYTFEGTTIAAVGSVGNLTPTSTTSVQLTGVGSIASVGSVKLYSTIDLLGEGVPSNPYSALVIDVPTDDVYTEINLDGEPIAVWTDLEVAA